MRRKIHALVFFAVATGLGTVIYHFLDDMGWQFALGVLFGAAVYQVGFYFRTGEHYGP